jgi:hypothetical protein
MEQLDSCSDQAHFDPPYKHTPVPTNEAPNRLPSEQTQPLRPSHFDRTALQATRADENQFKPSTAKRSGQAHFDRTTVPTPDRTSTLQPYDRLLFGQAHRTIQMSNTQCNNQGNSERRTTKHLDQGQRTIQAKRQAGKQSSPAKRNNSQSTKPSNEQPSQAHSSTTLKEVSSSSG